MSLQSYKEKLLSLYLFNLAQMLKQCYVTLYFRMRVFCLSEDFGGKKIHSNNFLKFLPSTDFDEMSQRRGEITDWERPHRTVQLPVQSGQTPVNCTQARSQTFERGGGNFQEFMNTIYPEGDIVTKIAHRKKILNKCLPILQFWCYKNGKPQNLG